MAEEQQEEDQAKETEVIPTEAVEATEATVAKVAMLSKESSAESSGQDSSVSMDNVYHVKWIGWNKQKLPIITQNANGPCPMLAIANVLLLRGKMTLEEGAEIVSSEQLLEYLGKLIDISIISCPFLNF